jgi:hypothetical protein
MNFRLETLVGLIGTLWFAFTHPGHEQQICTALAALWAYTHGKGGNGSG